MYFDSTYLYLIIPTALFALWASHKVKSTFNKYQAQTSSAHITGAMAARKVLDANGLQNLPIQHIKGELTDHYDPSGNVIRLSQSVYGDTSTAAIGVACHETGHALQYKDHYPWIKIRMAIIPITNFGSKLALPLIIIGLILGRIAYKYIVVSYIGVGLFSLSTLFQLLTLPVEFNASRRALEQIKQLGILNSAEIEGARKVLFAAALTYVAALASSLAQLLRFLIILSGNRRRD